jgi:hypothetical protein
VIFARSLVDFSKKDAVFNAKSLRFEREKQASCVAVKRAQVIEAHAGSVITEPRHTLLIKFT